jgi:Flp pilus assembly pilin Flp
MSRIRASVRCKSGTTTLEYGLVAAGISLAIITVMISVATIILNLLVVANGQWLRRVPSTPLRACALTRVNATQ